MSVAAGRILRGISAGLSLYGGVLVIGDIASAYCAYRKSDFPMGGNRGKAANDCDVNFSPDAWSCAAPRDF